MLQGILLGLIEMLVIIGIYSKYHVVIFGKEEDRKQWLPIMGIGILTVCFNILLLRQNYRIHTCINLIAVYTILAILAGIDWKKKIIPNTVLGVGFLIKILLLFYEWMAYPDTFKETFFHAAAGFGLGLLFLLLLSFMTRHGIGYGDVKMFAWLGFCMGFSDAYSILFYSALAAAAAGAYLLLVKKEEKRKQLPFAPFVYAGCYLVLCMMFLRG